MHTNNYIDINRESWNSRLDSHLKSEFYDLGSFLEGKNSLNEIELNLLGDIRENLFYIFNAILVKTVFL